ncbi:LytTR family DNA-binding domain-containing protein [Roseivirga sp. E12]|uniref:LytR/AlgR family response regulator transcription factor n=1 Tax=Roseivirga sp. E12 TaxID=2819237 RepID=UPI001ABCE6F3|nr:LytTR family DNA-binding domain-containing protein [Roseivirga sp. E12]MBO3697360.1 response regulator transcription factor [Roseivirga sp. E12]
MNAIIVEDELSAKELLIKELAVQCPQIKVLTTSDTLITAVSLIKQYQPDILFLDVMIKGGTAFDLIDRLPELDSEIIFITSHDRFAIQAFRVSAVDYLSKPIDGFELKEAVEKVEQKIKNQDVSNHLNLLVSNYRNKESNDAIKIALPTQKGYSFVRPDEIIRCESDNTYTTFFLANGRSIIVSKTLKTCESMLESYAFFRVHNRNLINLKYIEEYERGEGGYVKMTDGSEIAVSRRRKESFIQSFKDHMP